MGNTHQAVAVADVLAFATDNQAAAPAWLTEALASGVIKFDGSDVVVKTPQGEMVGRGEDWIIRTAAGELYPCKVQVESKFRRCTVLPVDPEMDMLPNYVRASDNRHAWVPVERATLGAIVSLLFPGEEERDYRVVELDDLVIPGSVLAYCESVPPTDRSGA